jgi:diguanylate cyclase (GGDEF)-like protein
MDRLDQSLAHARRYGEQIAVMFIDLDNFKVVNDTLDHAHGDRLLVEIAKRLTGCVREVDTVTRFGGDEFVVVLSDVSSVNEAIDIAQRMANTLVYSVDIRGRQVEVTSSIGIALSNGGDKPDDLLRRADVAMYRAKEGGRNRVEVFDFAMHTRAMWRLQIEHDLRKALAERQLVLYYQPTVVLDGETTIGVEALIRWQHPERGLIPPGEFIPVAEESGLIVPIGLWVLREACEYAMRQPAIGPDGESSAVSVNLSARQFADVGLIDQIRAILADTGIDPARLTLEITESVLMDDAVEAIERLRGLKQLGVRIAVDDFGTGYSSLAYLTRFPIDVIKIDRSFTGGLGVSREDEAVVASVIGLAHSLDMRVVAEGIETLEQAERLIEMGCELGQGFYYGRPAPEEHGICNLSAAD